MRPTLIIDSLEGFRLTNDGSFLLADARCGASVAMHFSVMHEMLAALANAIACSERMRKKDRARKFTMRCAGWEVTGDKHGTGALILSFTLDGGAQLSFGIHRESAIQMHEVIGVATGQLPSFTVSSSNGFVQ
ncbi:hypothetical protein QCE47_16520 [Caballeronia sp. LZ025]|uniref:hypothetical protein n=1 Tax=Caballeronia TaxID=1827195 RepID=UPI001FD33F00|nr:MULTISPECIES: hypothetical protein [Caballeronia]MDR5733926.1 hypothetical protein [Caballeronia sp. LZ025]